MSLETDTFLKYLHNGIKLYSDDDEKLLKSIQNPQLADFEAKDQKINGPVYKLYETILKEDA